MTLHLIKLSAGAESVDDLTSRVKRGVERNRRAGVGALHDHVTRMFPRRAEELLAGGSLYWVVKGVVLVRHRIVGLGTVTGADGIERCEILLDPDIVETEAQPRRAFQGWRYLRPEDAPRDIKKGRRQAPPALRAELAELGLL